MESVQQGSVIAALEVGSTKVCIAVAEMDSSGAMRVLGFGRVPAAGIEHGSVKNVELAVEAIRRTAAEAEQTSGRKIDSVTVALTGKHLRSTNREGKLVVQSNEVTARDAAAAMNLAMSYDPAKDRRPTDVGEPRIVAHLLNGYILDDDDTLVADPVGMACDVLSCRLHLAVGSDSVITNLVKCIRRAGLDPEGLILQPWASAASCLTATEKELGVVLLDFGAGAVDMACYEKGCIQATSVIPTGCEVYTRDIASTLGCTLEAAEEIKLKYAHIGERRSDCTEMVHFTYEPTGARRKTPALEIVRVVSSRAEEVLRYIEKYYLREGGWLNRAAGGIVITGGGVRMPGFPDLVRRMYGLKVRTGTPAPIAGSLVNLVEPEDSAVMGVLFEMARLRREKSGPVRAPAAVEGVWGAVKRAFFGDFSS